MTRRCFVCDTIIPKARLDVLPETRVCVKHSTEKPVVGMMVFDHKTAPTLVIIHPENKEAIRRAHRFYGRGR
jgi:hypothetical protein